MIPVFVRVAGMGLLFLLVPVTCTFSQSPQLPVIPANLFNITSYGAVGDGVTTNTTAIQNALNDAALAGGGTVEFPTGVFLSGPLTVSNNINLQLDAGSVLRMLPYGSYPGGTSPANFIVSLSGGHDFEVSGTGTIDGQAQNSGWWTNGLSTSQRPILFYFNKCNRVLIENVTLENSPSMHLVFKSSGGNITITNITINTSGSSPNTDGIDLVGTNCLVENSSISDGDDCIALGSTGGTSSGTLITNCNFGFGHGCSIGSNTAGGVSNLTVINCTFNGTQYGIRMKSDNASGSGGEGGIAQNLFYGNLTMTNIADGAIVIYSYYNEVPTPIGVTPATAAGEAIPSSIPPTTCVWRNIIFSNITASVKSSGAPGIIWGRTEMPVTNVSLIDVNITAAARTFDVYNTYGFQFANSTVTVPAGNTTFTIFNAGMVLTNSTNATLSGLTSTNTLALYNSSASTTATDLFGANPITISGGTLAVSNNYIVPNSTVFDFAVGTNASTVRAVGNLTFANSTINVTNGAGFGPGTFTLFTYTGTKSGTYALGAEPPNFNETLTNTTSQIQLVVSTTGPSLAPVSLVWSNFVGGLNLSWPQDHIGWYLQEQTNSILVGLRTNWITLPGSAITNKYFLPINITNGCVFLRLEYP